MQRRSNLLTQILPEAEKYSNTVFVYEIKDDTLMLEADVFSQKLVCYFNPSPSGRS